MYNRWAKVQTLEKGWTYVQFWRVIAHLSTVLGQMIILGTLYCSQFVHKPSTFQERLTVHVRMYSMQHSTKVGQILLL